VAVSDGHSSTTSPYSHVGSQLAVHTACEEVVSFLPNLTKTRNFQQLHDLIQLLPPKIVRRWKQSVLEQATRLPELQTYWVKADVVDGSGCEYDVGNPASADMHDIWLHFGCTLLLATITSRWLLIMQIGDGEIVWVDDHSDVSVLSLGERQIGDATHSLCEPLAASQLAVQLLPLPQDQSPLLLLCTDGYAKSFASVEDFLLAAKDWQRLVYGGRVPQEQMDAWLDETTERGSGDDVTLALVYRRNAGWVRTFLACVKKTLGGLTS
jgi:serine/threonine protein phosphatase PrpC